MPNPSTTPAQDEKLIRSFVDEALRHYDDHDHELTAAMTVMPIRTYMSHMIFATLIARLAVRNALGLAGEPNLKLEK